MSTSKQKREHCCNVVSEQQQAFQIGDHVTITDTWPENATGIIESQYSEGVPSEGIPSQYRVTFDQPQDFAGVVLNYAIYQEKFLSREAIA